VYTSCDAGEISLLTDYVTCPVNCDAKFHYRLLLILKFEDFTLQATFVSFNLEIERTKD
jgi:hypothetical protein